MLPIKPEYAERILNGTKKFEYRRRLAKGVDTILLYETAPVKKVVGEVKVIGTRTTAPCILWADTWGASGITKEDYDKYFEDSWWGGAYVLGDATRFKKPKELKDYGINYTPQSYVYIREDI